MRHTWIPEMNAALQELYPQHLGREVRDLMNAQFGTQLTLAAIQTQAADLMLTHEAPPGYYTAAEVALMYGCTQTNIQARIRTGGIKAVKMGRRMMIPTQELAKLDAWYLQKAPWPSYTCSQVCQMLSYTTHNVCTLIARGRLTAIKSGREWLIKRDEVDKGIAYLKRTGSDQVPWKKLKAG